MLVIVCDFFCCFIFIMEFTFACLYVYAGYKKKSARVDLHVYCIRY